MTNDCKELSGLGPVFRVPFGIGCWNFGLKLNGQFSLSVPDYRASLVKELETIPSLSNLEIISNEKEVFTYTEEHLEFSDSGLAVFPGQEFFSIKFELYIPLRKQQEIVGPSFSPGLNTEKFRIHNLFPYHGPVAYVELIADEKAHSPSHAVWIVREYLEEQINRMPGILAFEFVGPSPFHADFWLEGHKTPCQSEYQFECKQSSRAGYTDITFLCCTDNFYSKKDACEALFRHLKDELDLFYVIIRSNKESFREWGEIETVSSKLCEQLRSTNLSKKLRAMLSRAQQLSNLHISLSRFESEHISRTHYDDTLFRNLYNNRRPKFLLKFIKAELKDRPIFAVKQMKDLVSFIEARRSKAIELAIVLVAAVVGGIAGSTITFLAN